MKNKSINNTIIGAIAIIGIAAGSTAFAQSTDHSSNGAMSQMDHQTATNTKGGNMSNGGMNMKMAQATMRDMQEKFAKGEMPDQETMNEMRETMQKKMGNMGNMNHDNQTGTTHHNEATK